MTGESVKKKSLKLNFLVVFFKLMAFLGVFFKLMAKEFLRCQLTMTFGTLL